MFKNTRIKLTLLYLGIIMAISVAFSIFIFRMVSFEFERRVSEIERRLELRQRGFLPPPGESQLFIVDVRAAQTRVFVVLVYTNMIILVFSSVVGYFLAGVTLHPIENALNEQKRFVADASHELKTPLTALQTSIEVALRDKKITLPEALFTLKDSLRDIKSMTTLTNDLLSLTRYRQNGFKEYFEEINVRNVILGAIKKITPIAEKKKINLKFSGSDLKMNGSKESMEKLFMIFLDNAVKYSNAYKKIEIKLTKKKNYALIEIKDEGVGIAKKDMPYIFERFFRSDTSRSKVNASGYGLGLSIAKSIIDIYKGSIVVEGEVGKGSMFTIKLPVE